MDMNNIRIYQTEGINRMKKGLQKGCKKNRVNWSRKYNLGLTYRRNFKVTLNSIKLHKVLNFEQLNIITQIFIIKLT